MIFRSALACVLLSSTAASAQSGGGGLAGSGDARTTWHWAYSNVSRDTVQLRAVIILRGARGWKESSDSLELHHERRVLDSLRAMSFSAGRRGGLGYALRRTRVWLEMDTRAGELRFGDLRYPWPPTDSIRILVADRVDHVGGSPSLVTLVVPAPRNARVPESQVIEAMALWRQHLRTLPTEHRVPGLVP